MLDIKSVELGDQLYAVWSFMSCAKLLELCVKLLLAALKLWQRSRTTVVARMKEKALLVCFLVTDRLTGMEYCATNGAKMWGCASLRKELLSEFIVSTG